MNWQRLIDDKTILITGGTGSFGQAFLKKILKCGGLKKIIVFSRDEWKQSQMQEDEPLFRDSRIRYFLGDIRDKARLAQAFREVDYIVHAAALKQVPAAEYNPSEFIKTNILGTLNVLEAAIDEKVKKVVSLSTDKAVCPINLYGATKLCAEKLILSGRVYVGNRDQPKFCSVRYGNVVGSKGSLIPKWLKQIEEGVKTLQVTDPEMTRFWMTLDQAVDFVLMALEKSEGGEVFVPKIPSMKVVDLARALAPDSEIISTGIRPGEKIHEHLITHDEARHVVEYKEHYVIQSVWGKPIESNVALDFEYVSNKNEHWLEKEDLLGLLNLNLTTV